ncbi:hypothetical protein LNQ81_08055 [Myroides sp. M-43]|uniref:hypothetical protein n=1 Tax=Myroides oncorhynchi TaxID=2893756 RepID=UPI001E58E934|nr:hypothetical protein [Myroides oncorhynchi]MCC9042641.1 hypothetical protein [Myroides oncorhynchi]
MRSKVNLIFIISLVAFVGCNKYTDVKNTDEPERVMPLMSPVVSDTKENVFEYLVEGVNKVGDYFVGKVRLVGETGAGYIAKDSISLQFYIEVRRVQEGGLIGTDTNGVEYKLSFKKESNH